MPGGGAYSVEEVRGWLAGGGWRFVEHKGVQGATSLVVAEAATSP